MECYKCDGKGVIDGFAHVANGRCFLCMGSGWLPKSKKKNIGYSKTFVSGFMQPGFSPSIEDLETAGFSLIRWTGYEDHPTAKQGLFTDNKHIIYCQPICRAGMWFKVPLLDFPEFCEHYLKAFKKDLSFQHDIQIHQSRSVLS